MPSYIYHVANSAVSRGPLALTLHRQPKPVVLAVVNNKGGVGKTTTCVNVGAALASPKRRVLLVDLDGQASASLWCGIARADLKPSSATCLLDHYPVTKAIRHTSTSNLHLITASTELANVDLALRDVSGRELTLRRALQQVRGRYEFVILDCPPSLSLIGVNALVAADALVVPVTPQFLAIEGLTNMLSAVDEVRKRLGARAKLLGILLTMVGPGKMCAEVRERLRSQHRDRVFHTEIATSRALEEAPASGRTIFQCGPRTRAADAFQRLAGEILERISGWK